MAKIGARELRAALVSVMRDAGDTIVPGPGRGGAGDALAIHGVGGTMLGGLSGGMYGAATGADDDQMWNDIGAGAAIGGGLGVGRVAAAGLGGGMRSLRSALASRVNPRMAIDDAVMGESMNTGRHGYRGLANGNLMDDPIGNIQNAMSLRNRNFAGLDQESLQALSQARSADEVAEILRRAGLTDDDIADILG